MDRTHLIADTLGGTNFMWNIVWLHQTRNRSDMKKLENEARNRIASGQRVYYLAIPHYDHTQTVPIGISIYMASRSSNPAVPSSPVVDTWVPNTGR